MTDPQQKGGGAPPLADPLRDELEARAAELRALIAAAPVTASYGPAVGFVDLRERRRRRLLLASGGVLAAAGALLFVLIVTGVSLLGVMILAPGVLLLALAIGWRPFYWLYLPGLALAGWGAGMIVDKALGSPALLSLVGLGCGLMLAWLIRRFQTGWAHLWPLAVWSVSGRRRPAGRSRASVAGRLARLAAADRGARRGSRGARGAARSHVWGTTGAHLIPVRA